MDIESRLRKGFESQKTKLKCVITYRTSEQCGPDDYHSYTEVLYIDPNMSIRDIYFKHFSHWNGTDVNVNLNIHNED